MEKGKWRRGLRICAAVGLASAVALSGCQAANKPEAVDMSEYQRTYANPYPVLEEEWEDYGNGDPFVMRHDGRYYLYVSTKDHRVGIKAWESDDLVNWRYAGLVTEDPVSTGAYAPEVVYANGFFYLYTSPAGQGHYVFRSASPTGPFERITDNVGMSIDGSVFIDDDGSWTFTHAGRSGIVGVPMDGPADFGYGQNIPEAYLGHWTEGSMIIKRNGVYYMTFTGNHVFSHGYRIQYAISKESPLGPYTVPANNPIAINTSQPFHGLGHSSTVMGPDLDSHYIVYHNLAGRSAEGPPVRQMNVDRLAFNGDKMVILGPTNYAQPVPKLAEFSDRLDASVDPDKWETADTQQGGRVISRAQAGPAFTAEYNVRLLPESDPANAKLAALFGYADEANYVGAELAPAGNRLLLYQVAEGQRAELGEAALPPDTDWTALHTVRVERGADSLRVYFDGGLKLTVANAGLSAAGRIGYLYEGDKPVLSYTAFSSHADGTSDFEAAKPLPGSIEAVHYLSGAGRGFHVGQAAENAAWRRADGTDVRLAEDGSYAVALNGKGDWLRYVVNVSEAGTYAVDMTVESAGEAASVDWLIDDEAAASFTVPADRAIGDAPWVKVRVGTVRLEPGIHTLTVKLKNGRLAWKTMDVSLTDVEPFRHAELLNKPKLEDVYGFWKREDAGFAGNDNADVKRFGGSPLWSDYRIDTTVQVGDDPAGHAGVLLRVTNESDHPDQVSDALMGYFVAVSGDKLQLFRHNYDSYLLQVQRVKLPRNVQVPLRIEAVGSSIRVFVDDAAEPALAYEDPDAFMQGRVGIRSVLAEQIVIGDLTVESLPPE